MNIYLVNAIAGDRFVDPRTGMGWNVLANHAGYVKLVSDANVMHQGYPPVDMTVVLTNRDESLTHGRAVSNVLDGLPGTQITDVR